MDQYGLDKFSLVNFAVGMLWYQAGFSFVSLAIVFSIYKIVGNTSLGMYLNDKYLQPMFGFKLTSESYKNIGMDLLFCFAGWFAGHLFVQSGIFGVTSALIGFALYYWNPKNLKQYIMYILGGLGVGGLIFKQLWYLALGLGAGYAVENLRVVNVAKK
jgi:hypothetical protein